jgi:D-alanine-D-alanine ligase
LAEGKEKGFQSLKILVLGGGNSTEREVSLRSAKSIAQAARQAGYDVMEADPSRGLDILDSFPKATIIFPILHGAGGEDGVLQAALESRNLPYLGSDSESSAKCFDKWITRETLKDADLPIVEGAVVTKASYKEHQISREPHVLKVRRGGSSIGTLIVRDPSNLSQGEVEKIFKLDDEVILERLIIGTEVTIPILGSNALPVIEIRPPEGLEFDYENKYNGMTAEICPPESVSTGMQQKAQRLSEKVHKVMKCRHLSRVDIMVDQSYNLYVLEINTIPGLTDQSLYPKAALVAGLTMPELVKRFADMVIRDYNL